MPRKLWPPFTHTESQATLTLKSSLTNLSSGLLFYTQSPAFFDMDQGESISATSALQLAPNCKQVKPILQNLMFSLQAYRFKEAVPQFPLFSKFVKASDL
jgi:hypothetical protein